MWLYTPVCVGPGHKPRRPGFPQRGSILIQNIVTAVKAVKSALYMKRTTNQFVHTDTSFDHRYENQRTNGPVNAHLISWPSKAQNIQNLENVW